MSAKERVFLLKLLESLNCFVKSRALLFRKDKYMSGHFSLLKIKKEIQREQKLIIGFINNMRRIVVQEEKKTCPVVLIELQLLLISTI